MKKYQIIDGLCNLVIISGLPLDETYHEWLQEQVNYKL